METKWEPAPEDVEALAAAMWVAPGTWPREPWERLPEWQRNSQRAEARFVLARQHEREADAKLALRYLAELGGGNSEGNIYARRALERWERLDAKPVPTLLEAAKAANAVPGTTISGLQVGCVCVAVPRDQWDAVKAAVEREERKK